MLNKIFELAERGYKSFTWNGNSSQWRTQTLYGDASSYTPASARDHKPAWCSSSVWPILNFAFGAFPEARPIVEKKNSSGVWVEIDDHPATLLLENPMMGNATYANFCEGWILSRLMSGNSYNIKLRNMFGKMIGLWHYPHYGIKPVWDDFQWPGAWIHHYETTSSHGGVQVYAPQDVLHSRLGMNPENTRMGMSPLTAIMREIMTDEEVAIAAHAMSQNSSSTLVISPKDSDSEIIEEEADALIRLFMQKTTGEKRGQPLIPNLPVDVTKVGWSPAEMAFDKMRALPINRICAAFNIDPMAVSLPSDSGKYMTLEQARAAAHTSFIAPMYVSMAQDFNMWLIPEFGDSGERVNFDKRGVRVLQGDEDNLMDRAVTGYRGGVLKRSEARQMTHNPYDNEDDVYITDQPEADVAGHTSILENSRRGEPQVNRVINSDGGNK